MNWYLQNGNEDDVILFSKIKLVRNISGVKFGPKARKEDLETVFNKMKQITPAIGYGLKFIELDNIPLVDRECLVEKHIITEKFAEGKYPKSAIIMNDEESITILVNSENHIEIQVMASGLELKNLLELAIEIDQKIEKMVPYSYSKKYGYLTTSPREVGTGLRTYTYVHLPALELTSNMRNLSNIISNVGLNIKGVYGENNKVEGDLYVISNNQTLGVTEKEVVKNVNLICNKVMEQERAARKYLGKRTIELEDSIYRSYGILSNCRKLSFTESLNLLSNVKMGVDLGIISELNDKKIKELYLYTMPANLFKRVGQDKKFSNNDEEIARAKVVKQIISEN